MITRLTASLVLVTLLSAASWLHARSPQAAADVSLRDQWLALVGKQGTLKTVDGRMIFAHQASGPNSQAAIEAVGRDFVTISAGGDGRQWRYTIALDRIELHIYR